MATLVTVTVTKSFCVDVRTAEPLVLVIVVVFETTEEVFAMEVVFEVGDMSLLVVVKLVVFDADVSRELSVEEGTLEFDMDAGEITEATTVELDSVLFT